MNYERFFPQSVQFALSNDAPGSWMPPLPDGCIRLSAGYPAPELIPTGDISSAVAQLLAEEHDLPLQYLGSARITRLKQQVKQRLRERGMQQRDNELLITSGACQAIDLVARLFLDDRSVVAVESPTYMEALEIFQNYTNQIISVPVDDSGMSTDALEQVLRRRTEAGLRLPTVVYTIPSFHNPTGLTMTAERRRRLLELASEFDFLIVEDDAYGELWFSEAPIPLKAMDEEQRVVHIGSLSKVVAPGLRIGWILCPTPLEAAISWFKKDLDHPFTEAAVSVYLETTNGGKRLEALRTHYRTRRDVMIRALERWMPASVTWHVPDGGFFVWLHAPGQDTVALLPKALQAGVAYVPGKYFFMDSAESLSYLRLSFSYLDPADLEEGVRRLGALLESEGR